MADREALDLFLGDMAAHQAQHVGETTPSKNQTLAAELFERLDQKRAAVEHRMVPEVAPDPLPPEEERPSRIEARKRGFTFKTEEELGEETPIAKVFSKRDLERYEKVMRRVELLLTKRESGPLGQPSWHDRVLAVLALRYAPPELRRTAAMQMAALVEESNMTFGPWWAERPKRIQVG